MALFGHSNAQVVSLLTNLSNRYSNEFQPLITLVDMMERSSEPLDQELVNETLMQVVESFSRFDISIRKAISEMRTD